MDAGVRIRTDGLGSLASLPDYLVNVVLLRCELLDLVALSCTSRCMRVMCCEEPLWQQHCLKMDQADTKPLLFKANWRQTALALLAETAAATTTPAPSNPALTTPAPTTPALSPPTPSNPPTAIPAPAIPAAPTPSSTPRIPPATSIVSAARPPAPVPIQSEFLYRRWLRSNMQIQGFVPPLQQPYPPLQRVPLGDISREQFRAQFDCTSTPCLLTGGCQGWQADHDWSFPGLVSRHGSALFSVSKPGAATGRCTMRLGDFWDYMHRQADEEPLYVFDAHFAEAAPGLLEAYHVPHVFDQDFFSVLGASSRPPHRWLVAGPPRSGAAWHVDPQMTSAWNALCSGRKRWALYPPGVVPPGVELVESEPHTLMPDDAFTSLQWFLEVYPTIPPDERPWEFIQEPGEVVYVPGGWWHMVLNLEASVAVTQNFVSTANMDRVICYLAHGSEHYHTHVEHYFTTQQLEAWGADMLNTDSDSGWETDSQGTTCDAHGERSLFNDSYEQLGIWPEGRSEADEGSHGHVQGSSGLVQDSPGVVQGSFGFVQGSPGLVEGSCTGSRDAAGGITTFMRTTIVLADEADVDNRQEQQVPAHGHATPAPTSPPAQHRSTAPACPPTAACAAHAEGQALLGAPAAWPASSGLPVFAFQRDRQLGGWLRALLAVRPELHGGVERALRRHVGLDHWKVALEAIRGAWEQQGAIRGACERQGAIRGAWKRQDARTGAGQQLGCGGLDAGGGGAPGWGKEEEGEEGEEEEEGRCCWRASRSLCGALPDVGADSLVFHWPGQHVVVKIFTEEAKPLAGLMASLEVMVPTMLRLHTPPPPTPPTADPQLPGPPTPTPPLAEPQPPGTFLAGPQDGHPPTTPAVPHKHTPIEAQRTPPASAAPYQAARLAQGVLEVILPLADLNPDDSRSGSSSASSSSSSSSSSSNNSSDTDHTLHTPATQNGRAGMPQPAVPGVLPGAMAGGDVAGGGGGVGGVQPLRKQLFPYVVLEDVGGAGGWRQLRVVLQQLASEQQQQQLQQQQQQQQEQQQQQLGQQEQASQHQQGQQEEQPGRQEQAGQHPYQKPQQQHPGQQEEQPGQQQLALAGQLGRMLAALHIRGHLEASARLHARMATPCSAHAATPPSQPASGPDPPQPAVAGGPIAWQDAIAGAMSWWHDRYGSVWMSDRGLCVSDGAYVPTSQVPAGGPHALDSGCSGMQAGIDAGPSKPPSGAGELQSRSTAAAAPPPPQGGPDMMAPQGGPDVVAAAWGPFLSFLNHRRGCVAREMEEAGGVPTWLTKQVEQYLSCCDPAVMLGLTPSSSNTVPVLIHADISSKNVFVRYPSDPATTRTDHAVSLDVGEPAGCPAASSAGPAPHPAVTAAPELLLLDFADAGFGDPLYDLVIIHASVFKWNCELLGACWHAYKRQLVQEVQVVVVERGEAGKVDCGQEGRLAGCIENSSIGLGGLGSCATAEDVIRMIWPGRGVRTSHRAMVYSLLHEEVVLPALWAKHATALSAPATHQDTGLSLSVSDDASASNGAGWSLACQLAPHVCCLAELVWGNLDKTM